MIYQKDAHDVDINLSGCYYLTLCRMVEIEKNVTYGGGYIELVKNILFNSGLIEDKCYLKNPNNVLKALNSSIRQVGKDGVFWGWVTDEQKEYDFIVFVHDCGDHNHFTLHNSRGKLLYDSMRGSEDYFTEGVNAIYYTIGVV